MKDKTSSVSSINRSNNCASVIPYTAATTAAFFFASPDMRKSIGSSDGSSEPTDRRAGAGIGMESVRSEAEPYQ